MKRCDAGRSSLGGSVRTQYLSREVKIIIPQSDAFWGECALPGGELGESYPSFRGTSGEN